MTPNHPKTDSLTKSIMTSGLPLELAVYDALVASLDADWIEPEYEFSSLDENGVTIQRSIDFVASVPTLRDPMVHSIQIFFLVECKYANPRDAIWLFMPDRFSRDKGVFDEWRPALWQDREPNEPTRPFSKRALTKRDMQAPTRQTFAAFDPLLPKCVRGVSMKDASGESQNGGNSLKRTAALATGLHQLRDALHQTAIDRFRLFTKEWAQPAALIFVPLLITNAELSVLKPGSHARLLASEDGPEPTRDDIAVTPRRVLVRCPSGLSQIDWKLQSFQKAHGKYDLRKVKKGLPAYKRNRSIEAHMANFFQSAPAYVLVANHAELPAILSEVVEWAKGLRF